MILYKLSVLTGSTTDGYRYQSVRDADL